MKVNTSAKDGFITFDVIVMPFKIRSASIILSGGFRGWRFVVWSSGIADRFAFTVERHGLRIQIGSVIITRSLMKGY